MEATAASKGAPRKVLRVAVVWNGRVLEERLLSHSVTLGPGGDLPIFTRSLPRAIALLRRTKDGARLLTTGEMRGEIGPEGRELSLEHLRGDASRSRSRRGGNTETYVWENERGFLAVDRMGVYFDFVDPPPRAPRGAILGDDRSLLGLIGVCLVAALVAVVALTLVKPGRPRLAVEQLAPRYIAAVARPPPPPTTRAGKRREAERRSTTASRQASPPPPAGSARAEAERLGVAGKGLLGALHDGRESTGLGRLLASPSPSDRMAGALAELRSPTSVAGLPSADAATRSAAGEAAPALDLGKGGVGTGTVARSATPALGGRSERAVDFFREARKSTTEGGTLAREDIDRVVRANKGGIAYCYEKELARQPDLSGRIELSWVIGLDGKVESSRISRTSLKNAAVESCLARVVQRWKFPAPQGGKCRVVYPFTFGRAS